MGPVRRPHDWLLLAAVAFFLLVTACHWAALPTLITWDGHEYLTLSDILGSNRFPHDWPWLRAPLFPLSLKLTFALLGRNPVAAKAVPLSMAVLGCLLVASCVRRVAGARAATICLILLAVYPTLIAFEHAILTETGTFFIVALALRLSLWRPETTRAVWSKAVTLGLVLGVGYYWRQSILVLAPWFALLHLLAARSDLKWRRGSLQLASQSLAILLIPWLLKAPWSLRFESGERSAHVVQAFAIKQALFPIDDPRVARAREDYSQAIETTERDGSISGMSWIEASRIADKIDRPASASVSAYMAQLVAQYPARYAAAVGRTLLFFGGLDGSDNAVRSYRTLVLSPSVYGASIGAGPEPVASRFRQEFFHRTTPGSLQRALWSLCGVFDLGLIVCNIAVVALLATSIRRKDLALLAIAGTPLAFALAHAILLFSTNRFMVPIYPITIACGVISAAILAGVRLFKKETKTMTTRPRAFRTPTVALALAGTIAALAIIYAYGRSPRSEESTRAGIPAATKPAGSPSQLEANAADVLPGLICGSLDGATPMDGGGVFVWGWAYDPRTATPASAVILLDNGQRVSPPISVSQERPDVADAKANPRLRASGWNFRSPATVRRDHLFEAYAVLADGKLGRLGGRLAVSEPTILGAVKR
jgi:4-amino-4-deoxy-L-arabinose transferase-like glycosyltransferase